jgi:hypothetical protein
MKHHLVHDADGVAAGSGEAVTAAAAAGDRVGRLSAMAYTGTSLAIALGFVGAATIKGGYTDVARLGGAVWVFLLSMIVTMPLLTSWVRKRVGS